ncbi:hypothetical protein DUI87_08819 [Hirundo rustica rustica]|uniref:Uncharacterized protein n=1 Tax=Hirundo rustica rustica TaxID=333673 RepID=A0A3M0L319_HIRRU|nr:hypothetical protein DUI87_08819 [Hirundo rustica rustica]
MGARSRKENPPVAEGNPRFQGQASGRECIGNVLGSLKLQHGCSMTVNPDENPRIYDVVCFQLNQRNTSCAVRAHASETPGTLPVPQVQTESYYHQDAGKPETVLEILTLSKPDAANSSSHSYPLEMTTLQGGDFIWYQQHWFLVWNLKHCCDQVNDSHFPCHKLKTRCKRQGALEIRREKLGDTERDAEEILDLETRMMSPDEELSCFHMQNPLIA